MFGRIWNAVTTFFSPRPLPAVFKGRVIQVIDGDSLVVSTGFLRRHTIRLAGVDAPEYQQAYGLDALQCLTAVAQYEAVTVHQRGIDKYHRIVAKVETRAGDVALQMLGYGYTWHNPAYSQKNVPESVAAYAHASHEARRAKRGLWQQENPVHPAQFRAARRRIPAAQPAIARQGQLF